VLKSSGISPQQILSPFVWCAFLIASLWLFLLHPIGQALERTYARNVNGEINGEINRDLWIDHPSDNSVIYLTSISKDEVTGLHMFFHQQKNGGSRKIFAQTAKIGKTFWRLNDITIVDDDLIKTAKFMKIKSNISHDLIKMLSLAPRKHDIYGLYKIYQIQNSDGTRLKFYELALHKLLANCLNFILFAVIAGVLCFPINRYKTKTSIVIEMIVIAILLRFANNTCEALAYTGVLPAIVASWAVTLGLLCSSISILIWKEL
jgi:lipopolysaccharide export LptBFGC system permease protein LptF